MTGGATFALYAASETPPARIQELRRQFEAVLQSGKFMDFTRRYDLYLTGQTPAEVMKEISEDVKAIKALRQKITDNE